MTLRITIPQINVTVGDFLGNFELIKQSIKQAYTKRSDIILFPELCITGYPPEDLLLRPHFLECVNNVLTKIQDYSSKKKSLVIIIGAPQIRKQKLYNMAIVFQAGKRLTEYAKQCLPNYRVFDEKRYFQAGKKNTIIVIKNCRVALLICEDLWNKKPLKRAVKKGVDLVLVLNASPFYYGKFEKRLTLLKNQAAKYHLPIVYSNMVGAQDELIYDGQSMVIDALGQCIYQAPLFKSDIKTILLPLKAALQPSISSEILSEEAMIYQALVLGVKDYVRKNGFSGVIIGLSGGIDSALTLSIAVDALGANNVEAVMMPFNYTADISKEDAKKQAKILNVKYQSISIEKIVNSFMDSLKPLFDGLDQDTTEENIQARSRGIVLMALSNKLGKMLLATGNKSEMSVGYATLYGDMAGGYAPLKDVYKLLVYRLSYYVNQKAGKEVIPNRVIERAPSAELAPNQVDQDTLPPYEELDVILEQFIEGLKSVDDIVAMGFDRQVVKRIVNMVLLNEHKRRQAAPGIRITQRAFGKDRRYPITSYYRDSL